MDVDPKKWDKFRKWCVANNTTIRKEIDRFLDVFNKNKKGDKDEE